MAFNPFRAFRKHQKVVFAALTIICMLTFVFASGISGGGGFLDEISRWFGMRSRIPDAGNLYGRPVSVREIQLLQEQRRLANQFMATAVSTAQGNLVNQIDKKVPDFVLLKQSLQSLQQQAMFIRLGFVSIGDYARQLDLLTRQLADLASKLATAKKPDDVKLIELLQTALERDFWRMRNQDELVLYFGGTLSLDGCLDFMIWQHQADRLGIKLTPDDVKKAIGQETLNFLTKEDSGLIQRSLQPQSRAGPMNLLAALGEEFRVRLAKDALLGQDPSSLTQAPAPVTPYELWDYYLQHRTQASVKLLPIPVSRFLGQVIKQPSEKELLDLYEKYKNEVHNPGLDTPGFKQPRRVKIAWVEPSPESEYYRKQTKSLLLSQVAAMVGNPLQAAVLITPLLKAYDRASDPFLNSLKAPDLTQPDFALAIYTYKSFNRPETIASTLGLAATPELGALAAALTVPARAAARESTESAPVVAQEARNRLPFSVALLGAGSSTLPNLCFAATWLASEQVNQVLPMAAVKDRLLKDLEGDLAKNLVDLDKTNLKEELDKLKKEFAKQPAKYETAAREFTQKWIERHQWKHGESSALRDQYDIGQDPGLKPLEEAYLSQAQTKINDPKGKRFGDVFFSDPTASRGKTEATADRSKLYTPQEEYFGDKATIFWRIEDQASETLPFDKVRTKVAEAWRFNQARELARAEAERLAKEAQKTKDPIPTLREAAKGETLIDIDGIARLERAPSMMPQFSGTYKTYKVPESKIEYASAAFVDKVLDLKQVNDVTVVADAPKDIYYVAVLTNRSEPEIREFREAALLPRLEQERRLEYRLGTMRELRAQARLKVYEEGQKLLADKDKSSPLQED